MAALHLVLASASPARLALLRAAGIVPEVVVSAVDEDAVTAALGTDDPDVVVAALARAKAEVVAGRVASARAPAARPGGVGAGAGRVTSGRVVGGGVGVGQPAGPPGAEGEVAAWAGADRAAVGPVAEDRAGAPGADEPGSPPAPTLVLGCDSLFTIDGTTWGKPASAAEAGARIRSMRHREGVLRTGHHLVDIDGGRAVGGVEATTVRFGPMTEAEVDAYVATGEPLAVAGSFTLDGRSAPFVDGVVGDHTNVVGLSLPLLRRLLAGLGRSVTELWEQP